MSLQIMSDFSFKWTDVPGNYMKTSAADTKNKLDMRDIQIRDYLISVIDVLNNEGASHLGAKDLNNISKSIQEILTYLLTGDKNKGENLTALNEFKVATEKAIELIDKAGKVNAETLLDLKNTFDVLVINAGNSNAEIAAARYDNNTNTTYKSLSERLDKSSEQMESKVNFLEDVSADFDTPSNEIVDSLNTLKSRVDEHITNHPTGGGSGSSHTHSNLTTLNKITESKIAEWDSKGNTSIDDTTLAKDKAWSSQKTYDFVLANANTTMADINGGDVQTINYTKEGYLSEVELFGSQENQNLGKLVVDGIGNPILDSQGRQQYNIGLYCYNKNLFTTRLIELLTTLENWEGGGAYRMNYKAWEYLSSFIKTNSVYKINSNKDVIVPPKFYPILIICDSTGASVGNIFTSGGYSNNTDSPVTKPKVDTKWTIGANKPTSFKCYVNNWNKAEMDSLKQMLTLSEIQIEESSSATTYANSKESTNIITLPCQLQKVGDVKDRLYFDKTKNKYVVEKNNSVAKGVPQIIDTNIAKEMLVPTYRGRTYVRVTDNVISGGIKAKAPIDTVQAVQTLSMQTMSLEEENQNLRTVNEQQDQLINVSMLATDELYTMIEPSLPQSMGISVMSLGQEENINMKVKSPMVDMYVAMVLRGLKTIDEVPIRFREDVRKILEQLGGATNE